MGVGSHVVLLYTVSCSITGTPSGISEVHAALPVDPSLSATTPTVLLSTALASAPVSLVDTLAAHSVVDISKPPTVVVTEGIPPVPCRMEESEKMGVRMSTL